MAYDAADGQVVLFGGELLYGPHYQQRLGDTWTWDGSTWTKRFPVHSPSPRASGYSMGYDSTTGQVVLVGGSQEGGVYLNDTWTWDGTDWTQQHPAHSPPYGGSIVDYPPGHEAVLFLGPDAWTWDGADWTQHAGEGPGSIASGAMTYDAANKDVVQFGGFDDDYIELTMTWDGTHWTERNPVHSPKARDDAGMTYDSAVGRVVLFGGRHYNTTWTWNGTDWRHRRTRHQPLGGRNIAYDAQSGNVVSFNEYSSTWTWNGTDWTQHPGGSIGALNPQSGAPGELVSLLLWSFASGEQVEISFDDSRHGSTVLKDVPANGDGFASVQVTIPSNAAKGKGFLVAEGLTSHQIAKARFNVT
jgi:hypothetical protein